VTYSRRARRKEEMYAMLASGGYPWTVIPLEERDAYMGALEDASEGQNIGPFSDSLGRIIEEGVNGKAAPEFPSS
jgi:hypothetical protein